MTAQLPTPGGDNGTWGSILNTFLGVAHNNDGSLLASAVQNAGAITKVNGQTPSGGAITLAPSDISALPTTTKLSNLTDTAAAASAANNQVLSYNSTSSQWIPATVTSTTVNNATSSIPGLIQLDGDLGGSATSPSVTKLNGTTISGTPNTGQVLTATSGSAAMWQTVASGSGSSTLSGDSDVSITSPSSNQVLSYNIATSKWNNTSLVESNVANLTADLAAKVQLSGDLSGTTTSPTVAKINGIALSGTPSTGQVLTASSGTAAAWATPTTGSGSSTLAGDTDVAIASPTNNQVLTYNATAGKWQNVTSGSGVTIDATASDIQADTTSGTAIAGSTNKAADAGHQHPLVAHDHTTTNKGGQIPVTGLSASGTPSTTTYLRGDGSWSTPAAGGTVSSVFGRAGAVVATSGDYTATQVGALAATNDLASIATTNPTANNVSMNTHKITNVGNGNSATDVAAFGQVPTAGTGSSNYTAGNATMSGDLSGTLPSPTVAKINGVVMPSSAPTGSNQVLTTTTVNTTVWATPASGTVSSVNGNTGAVTIAAGHTLVVAASNATTKVKDGADYVCTGTADQTIINSAISTLPTTGGTIFFSAGTFNVTGPITVTSSNVTLEGTGVSTEFNVTAGTNISSVISVTGTGTVEVKLRKFFIQGSYGDTNGDGILIDTPWSTTDTQHVLEDVYITNCPNNGVHISTSADTRVLLFSRVHVKNCKGNGFYMAYPSCTDSVFDSCIADTIGLSGFYVGGANCNYISCKAFYCGNTGSGYGFQVIGYNNYFTRCEAQDNYQSGFYGDNSGDATYGSFGCTFVNCLADSNGQNGGSTALGYQINGSKQWQIIGGLCINRPYGSYWQNYGISMSGTAAFTTISGVTFIANNTSPIIDTSTGPNFVNAPNYSGSTASNTTTLSSVTPTSGTAFTPNANQKVMLYIPILAGSSAAVTTTIKYGPSTGSENTILSAAPTNANGSAMYPILVPINWKVVVTISGSGSSISACTIQPA
jgi:hypothetical protein